MTHAHRPPPPGVLQQVFLIHQSVYQKEANMNHEEADVRQKTKHTYSSHQRPINLQTGGSHESFEQQNTPVAPKMKNCVRKYLICWLKKKIKEAFVENK